MPTSKEVSACQTGEDIDESAMTEAILNKAGRTDQTVFEVRLLCKLWRC